MRRLVLVAALLAAPAAAQAQDDPAGLAELEAEAPDDGRTPAEREKAAMRRRVAEDRVRTQFLRREETTILGAIAELDRELEAKRRRALAVLARRQKVQAELARADAAASESELLVGELRAQIGRRVAAMARLRRTALADLLAHAGSAAGLRRLREAVARVVAYDARLVREMRAATQDAEKKRAALVAEQAALAKVEADLDAEREALGQTREDRAALLRAIRGERENVERLAGEIAQAAQRLDAELTIVRGAKPAPAPAPGGFAAQKGRLPWPAVGKVEVPFGKRVDPDTGVVMSHKGLDLRAGLAEPVRAVFRGRVAFQGTLEGFGRVVVVDHGDAYFTVSAHLESFAVASGAEVEAGQVIGHVGDSGSIKGPYLYFELRQGRAAVDPTKWLAR